MPVCSADIFSRMGRRSARHAARLAHTAYHKGGGGFTVGSGCRGFSLSSPGNPIRKRRARCSFRGPAIEGRGQPLHELLGAPRGQVVVGAGFGVQEPLDILIEKLVRAVDEGFP